MIPNTKVIKTSMLTPDCWEIQFWGIAACEKCESLGTSDCGGERIRAMIKAGTFPREGLPSQRKEEKKNGK